MNEADRKAFQKACDDWVVRADNYVGEFFWNAALAHRDKQAWEPIYIVGKGWQCDEMPPEGMELYTTPPAAQVNEQMLGALKHLHHNASKSGADMGFALDVAKKAIVSAQKLKYEAAKSAKGE